MSTMAHIVRRPLARGIASIGRIHFAVVPPDSVVPPTCVYVIDTLGTRSKQLRACQLARAQL